MKNAWVITDGSAGMENQALGLAKGLTEKVEIKRIKLRQPWLFLAPFLRIGLEYCLSPNSDPLTPPWPDLIVACGRRSILPTLMVKKLSNGHTKTIYLQNPKISTSHFDVVVCPAHDNLSGNNVIQMVGAPHLVNPKALTEGEKAFGKIFDKLKSPRVGVLIGGPNRAYKFDEAIAINIIKDLKRFQAQTKASLLITPSRRTPPAIKQLFLDSFNNDKNTYIWDFKGANPYFGILAISDAFIVTCDSVSMISELCSTTKPVYIISLPGGNKKFNRFHSLLRKIGRTLKFTPNSDPKNLSAFKPIQEMNDLIQECNEHLLSRGNK